MNKQNFFGLLAVVMIAAVAAFNVSLNSQKETLSDLAMENVEALAFEYPTLSCTGYCLWHPSYNCSVYVYNGYYYEYKGRCSGYRG